METRRLKNIVLIILLILNLFLLVLLLNFRFQGARAHRAMLEELDELFSANAITLSSELDLDAAPLASLSVRRDLDREAEIAALLLGETAVAEHQGGGIYSYTGLHGVVHFRSSGNFDYVPSGRLVPDPQEFCLAFCESYGYEPAGSFYGDTGTFTATQYLQGSAVYNCTVSIRFQDGELAEMSGTYAPAASAASEPASMTAVDALVRLLDYRSETGVVCNSVQDITAVYELQSGPSAALQLAAKWQITADSSAYYVDCVTGEVVRA